MQVLRPESAGAGTSGAHGASRAGARDGAKHDGVQPERIDVRGAVDLHVHSAPCLFPRLGDDVEMAADAARTGLRAIVLKAHHESTVSRAYAAQRAVPDVRVFGGIVLNSYVGGINPRAAEAALRLGAAQVWLPTIDAAYHRQVYGRGDGGRDSAGSALGDGLSVLGPGGRLSDDALAVLELVAAHDAILGTAHISPREIEQLVPEAKRRGVTKILITHPFFPVPNLDLATLRDLVRLGAMAEFTYCAVSPMWRGTTVEAVAAAVQALGAANCVLTSDAGQRHNPYPGEALRLFAQQLHELGVAADDVYTMVRDNPARLLGLSGSGTP
mgnify:CR=1 FL=1